jgi:hypothetical protein
MASMMRLEKVRGPMMLEIVNQRIADGMYEQYESKSSSTSRAPSIDPERTKALKPRFADEVVNVRGFGRVTQIVRVRESETEGLAAIYESGRQLRNTYIMEVEVLLSPFRRRPK